MRNKLVTIVICILALLPSGLVQPLNTTQPDVKHPKLESVLSQLISAKNPEEFARIHNLYMQDGNVRVIIELVNDTVLLPDYVLEESRYKNRVQALVPIGKLTLLSEETGITFIRTPLKPFAGTPEVPDIQTASATQTPVPKSGFDAAVPFIFSIALVFLIKKIGAKKC